MIASFGDYRAVRAHLLDVRRIHRLEKAIFPQDAYPLFEIVLLLVFPRLCNYKLLAADGTVVGFVSASKPWLNEPAWIITLGIAHDHQRQGLGRFLLAWCEAKLKANRVRLTVRASNAPAIALYENTGYVHIGRHHGYYNDGEDGLVMEKLIKR
jgi:ribosomal protein S18 acetylase RimI-like enzyme